MNYLIAIALVASVSVICVLGAPQGYGAPYQNQGGNQQQQYQVNRYENELTPDNGGYKFVLVSLL